MFHGKAKLGSFAYLILIHFILILKGQEVLVCWVDFLASAWEDKIDTEELWWATGEIVAAWQYQPVILLLCCTRAGLSRFGRAKFRHLCPNFKFINIMLVTLLHHWGNIYTTDNDKDYKSATLLFQRTWDIQNFLVYHWLHSTTMNSLLYYTAQYAWLNCGRRCLYISPYHLRVFSFLQEESFHSYFGSYISHLLMYLRVSS